MRAAECGKGRKTKDFGETEMVAMEIVWGMFPV